MKAYELLSDKSKWCRYSNALDSDGENTRAHGPAAVCWCAQGALIRCYGDLESSRFADILRQVSTAAERLYGTPRITHVNDELGYEAVLEVLKEANV